MVLLPDLETPEEIINQCTRGDRSLEEAIEHLKYKEFMIRGNVLAPITDLKKLEKYHSIVSAIETLEKMANPPPPVQIDYEIECAGLIDKLREIRDNCILREYAGGADLQLFDQVVSDFKNDTILKMRFKLKNPDYDQDSILRFIDENLSPLIKPIRKKIEALPSTPPLDRTAWQQQLADQGVVHPDGKTVSKNLNGVALALKNLGIDFNWQFLQTNFQQPGGEPYKEGTCVRAIEMAFAPRK